MAKTKRTRTDDNIEVDLKERDWVKVLEVPVPADLVWLARINMLCPVQFERTDLQFLIYTLRMLDDTAGNSRTRAAYSRIADAMMNALHGSTSNTRTTASSSASPPNDKLTALKAMKADMREMMKDPETVPLCLQYKAAINALLAQARARRRPKRRTQTDGDSKKKKRVAGNRFLN